MQTRGASLGASSMVDDFCNGLIDVFALFVLLLIFSEEHLQFLRGLVDRGLSLGVLHVEEMGVSFAEHLADAVMLGVHRHMERCVSCQSLLGPCGCPLFDQQSRNVLSRGGTGTGERGVLLPVLHVYFRPRLQQTLGDLHVPFPCSHMERRLPRGGLGVQVHHTPFLALLLPLLRVMEDERHRLEMAPGGCRVKSAPTLLIHPAHFLEPRLHQELHRPHLVLSRSPVESSSVVRVDSCDQFGVL
mmetsp:Transcript_24683/g.48408  ORF Transcript_24683/g.48408 Transcript_24683/m.48408 type:complete len:244 (-) Transcript_24683:289-1020(-)